MKRITLSIMLLSGAMAGFCTTWTINNAGFTFSPATITITLGDSVDFVVASIHEPVEVSQTTWNNNDDDPLAGGFSLPNGGGLVLPDKLTVGEHFYVCSPHASMGMKGRIIVEEATATEEIHFPANISVFPNPSSGKFQMIMDDPGLVKNFDMDIYNVQGNKVYTKSKSEFRLTNEIDLSNLVEGIYIIRLSDGTKIYSKKILVE